MEVDIGAVAVRYVSRLPLESGENLALTPPY